MGRSPFFEDHVRFVPFRNTPELESLRLLCEDSRHDNLYIRIDKMYFENHLSTLDMLPMERSCSTYGLRELYLPVQGEEYKIAGVEHYHFGAFQYDMIAIQSPKNRMATFMIRSDGMLMNIESFEPRGYIIEMSIIHRSNL